MKILNPLSKFKYLLYITQILYLSDNMNNFSDNMNNFEYGFVNVNL